jgi:hypothetical protein
MPRNEQNQHVESTPHFDGEREGIISDPLATEGSQMGVTLEPAEEFAQEKNPFPFHFEKDDRMKDFNRVMGEEK